MHGEAERDAAEAAGRALFGQGDLADLPAGHACCGPDGGSARGDRAGREVVDGLLPPYDELFVRTGLAASKSAARRTIDEGGAYVNNVQRHGSRPAGRPVSDLHHGQWLVLRRGKKAFAGVRVARLTSARRREWRVVVAM